ncbi:unnamed protein product [Cylicostephanus goldi]|uniref:Uncharacterized protein n=1 Tax=Cylicostephanus goldi TaxID=71465 RepID=A0A3P6REF7_CYLGO|nr:unnamed protein product [Cylicostephanus goldi]
MSYAPTEARLTTPLLAIASTAAIPIEEAVQPEVPLKALRLLTYLIKEKFESGESLHDLIAGEQLLVLVDAAVKTSVETSKPEVLYQCRRITEGLRLAEVFWTRSYRKCVSIHGVAVVMELLRLLAALKDFSKLHKDQYWRSLKDPRLVAFLAYAVCYGDHEMVHNALVLYTHCSQLHAFPSKWLGDLIASCSQAKQSLHDSRVTSPNTSSEMR